MFTPLNRSMVVPVINHRGEQLTTSVVRDQQVDSLPLVREVWNSLWQMFYSEQPVVIIDWTEALEEIKQFAIKHKKGVGGVKGKALEKKMFLQLLSKPILFDGVLYHGDFYWGSAVKEKQTLGVAEDFLIKHITKCEASQRVSRWLLSNGQYGGMYYENPKILLLKHGAVFNGYRVADGCGLLPLEDALAAKREGSSETEYGQPAQTMYTWQRFSWPAIAKEASELIVDNLLEIGTIGVDQQFLYDSLSPYKKLLVDIEPKMAFHPAMQGAFRNEAKNNAIILGTTVPLETKIYYAVPGLCENDYAVVDEPEFSIGITYPEDDDSSIKAIKKNEHGDKEYESEVERLKTQQAVQHTTGGKEWGAKGSYQLIPKSKMKGYDIILCCEDVKIYQGLANLRDRADASPNGIVINPGPTVISIMQWIGPGQCCAVPLADWKRRGRDTDGDLHAVMRCGMGSMSIWNEARSWADKTSTYKIPKTTTPLFKRPLFIYNSMANLIGFATRTAAMSYGVPKGDRSRIAEALKQTSVDAMDKMFNRYIKWGTDIYKVFADADKISAEISKVQSILLREIFDKGIPWTGWRTNKEAFTHMLPKFERQLPKEVRARAVGEGSAKFRRSDEWTMHIQPEAEGGTIARIYALVLPWLEEQYEDCTTNGVIDDGATPKFARVPSMPLSDFIDWAPVMPDKVTALGYAQYQRFCVLIQQINFSNPDAIEAFKESWKVQCDKWCEENGLTRTEGGYALWRACCHSRSSFAGSAGVFYGFPDISIDIVRNKPGTAKHGSGIKTKVTGLNLAFSTIPDLIDSVEVEIRIEQLGNRIRKVIVPAERPDGMVDGETILGCVAVIEKRDTDKEGIVSPEPGKYVAKFIRRTSSDGQKQMAWTCFLSKL